MSGNSEMMPSTESVSSVETSTEIDLPSDWGTRVSSDGRTYYVEYSTGKSTWKKPGQEAGQRDEQSLHVEMPAVQKEEIIPAAKTGHLPMDKTVEFGSIIKETRANNKLADEIEALQAATRDLKDKTFAVESTNEKLQVMTTQLQACLMVANVQHEQSTTIKVLREEIKTLNKVMREGVKSLEQGMEHLQSLLAMSVDEHHHILTSKNVKFRLLELEKSQGETEKQEPRGQLTEAIQKSEDTAKVIQGLLDLMESLQQEDVKSLSACVQEREQAHDLAFGHSLQIFDFSEEFDRAKKEWAYESKDLHDRLTRSTAATTHYYNETVALRKANDKLRDEIEGWKSIDELMPAHDEARGRTAAADADGPETAMSTHDDIIQKVKAHQENQTRVTAEAQDAKKTGTLDLGGPSQSYPYTDQALQTYITALDLHREAAEKKARHEKRQSEKVECQARIKELESTIAVKEDTMSTLKAEKELLQMEMNRAKEDVHAEGVRMQQEHDDRVAGLEAVITVKDAEIDTLQESTSTLQQKIDELHVQVDEGMAKAIKQDLETNQTVTQLKATVMIFSDDSNRTRKYIGQLEHRLNNSAPASTLEDLIVAKQEITDLQAELEGCVRGSVEEDLTSARKEITDLKHQLDEAEMGLAMERSVDHDKVDSVGRLEDRIASLQAQLKDSVPASTVEELNTLNNRMADLLVELEKYVCSAVEEDLTSAREEITDLKNQLDKAETRVGMAHSVEERYADSIELLEIKISNLKALLKNCEAQVSQARSVEVQHAVSIKLLEEKADDSQAQLEQSEIEVSQARSVADQPASSTQLLEDKISDLRTKARELDATVHQARNEIFTLRDDKFSLRQEVLEANSGKEQADDDVVAFKREVNELQQEIIKTACDNKNAEMDKAELKDKINSLQESVVKLTADKEHAHANSAKLETNISKLQNELKRSEAGVGEALTIASDRLKLAKGLEHEVDNLQQKIFDLTVANEDAEADIAQFHREIPNLQHQVLMTTRGKEQAQAYSVQLESFMDRLQRQVFHLTADQEQHVTSTKLLNEKINSLEQEILQLQVNQEQAQAYTLQYEEEVAELKKQIDENTLLISDDDGEVDDEEGYEMV